MSEEYIFMWLYSYVNITYFEYLNIIKFFNSIYELYNLSLYSFKFKEFIEFNKIEISSKKIDKFCDYNLKKKSKVMFDYLKLNNVVVLTINSKYFPINLNNNNLIPIVVYAKGNLSCLSKIRVFSYYDNCFSKYGLKVYNDFCKYLKDNNICVISDFLSNNISVFLAKNIIEVINNKYENLLILSTNLVSINGEENNINYSFSMLFFIFDVLLIPESSYNFKCVNLVDNMLDIGKDIYVVPGQIYQKNSYFSNYLISLGAYVVTGKYNFLVKIKDKFAKC